MLLLHCSYVFDRSVLGVYIFNIRFPKLLMHVTITPLNLQEKCIISSSEYLFIVFTLILS